MKRHSTLFLRISLIAMVLFIIFLCILLFPAFLYEENKEFITLVCSLYIAALPFFYALYQAWKLLGYIDKKQAFSAKSVKALGTIRTCATAITGLFILYTPIFMERAQSDDAPGLFAICLIIAFMSAVIAVFTGTLQSLFRNALDIKSENDLTV